MGASATVSAAAVAARLAVRFIPNRFSYDEPDKDRRQDDDDHRRNYLCRRHAFRSFFLLTL